MAALMRGSEPVEVGNGLQLWPVTFGTLVALRKLGNVLVQDFMAGREMEMTDFEAVAEFFWAHTRPWQKVHEAVQASIAEGSKAKIEAEVFELSGLLTMESTKRMMKLLGEMQSEAQAAQVEIIPDDRHKNDNGPKN